jgi:hypothetical protein
MSGLDLDQLVASVKPSVLYSTLAEVFSDKPVKLSYNKFVPLDAPNEQFLDVKCSVRSFFSELCEAIEILTGLPVSAFAQMEFDNWLNNFDILEYSDASRRMLIKEKPTTFHIHCEVIYQKVKRQDKYTCELSIQQSLLRPLEEGGAKYYPISQNSICMIEYEGST